MNEYLFLLGPGHLPRSAARIAEKHGATLVNYTDPQCKCGHGCAPSACPASRRHWFAAANRGEPFNRTLSATLSTALAAATLGRKGGQTSTPAKSAAAQANGRKGGRKRIQAGTKTTLIKGHALNEMNGGALCHIFKRRAYRDNVIYRVTFNGLLPDSSNISKVEPARRGWETRVTD